MKNDLSAEQLAQPVTVTLPLSALLRLNDTPAAIAQAPASCSPFTQAPKLNAGELYVGTILSAADITRRYHLILLPGDAKAGTWKSQMDMANLVGGELPDRVEGALLFATMKDEFKPEAYWLREPYAGDESYAWYQYFGSGYQSHYPKSTTLRARAVRRFPIE